MIRNRRGSVFPASLNPTSSTQFFVLQGKPPHPAAWNRSSPDCLSQENDSDGGVTLVTSPSVFVNGSLSPWHRDLNPELCGRFMPSPVDFQSITGQRNVGKDPTHRVTIKRTLVITHRVDMNEDQLANASSSSDFSSSSSVLATILRSFVVQP